MNVVSISHHSIKNERKETRVERTSSFDGLNKKKNSATLIIIFREKLYLLQTKKDYKR